MADEIKGNEIIEDGHLDNATKSADGLLDVYKQLNKEAKELAKNSKDALGKVDTNSSAGIEKINNEVAESIKLRKASIEIQKKQEQLAQARIKTENAIINQKKKTASEAKKSNKLTADERKLKQANLTLNNKLAGTEEKLLATNVKLRIERKKLIETDKNYERDLKRINSALDKNNQKIISNSDNLKRQRMNVGNYGKAVGKITNVVKGFGVAMLASFSFSAVKSFFTDSVNAFRVQEKAVAKVTQAIVSTSGAAGKTTKDLKALASELQSNSLFGDEQILNDVSAQLLTFTNITGNEFDRTQQVALDLATVLDGDLKSASLQLGKALNDPVANLSALSRSGIQFSDSQKSTIKSLADTNQLAEAQNVILTELERQYGGQALAAAEADGGFTQLKNTFGDLMEVVGGTLLEAIKPLVKDLKEFLGSLTEEDIEEFTTSLKSLIDGLISLSKVSFESISGIFEWIDAWRHAFDSMDNFKNALLETVDGFTSFITLGFVNDLSDDILGLSVATDELTKSQREANAITRLAQTGIEHLKESVTAYIGKEQERINLLVEGNLTQEQRNDLINQLNEDYPELLKNYDTENLSQEDAIALNKELQKEITNTAILKQKALILTVANNRIEKEQAKIDLIKNEEIRKQKQAELDFEVKRQFARIDAVEKETRIKLGLLDEEEVLSDAVLLNAEENDKKRLKSAKKTSEKIIDQAEIEEQRLFDLRKQREKDQSDNDKENEKIRADNAKKEADRVAKQNADQEKVEQQRYDKIKALEAKRIEDFKFGVQSTADLLNTLADNLNQKLDSQIQDSKDRIGESESLITRLEAKADIGNLDAEESIKAEKLRIANEKNNIDALEKKKRDLQILVTGLAVANAKIQAGDGNALGNAGSQMGEFIAKLKGFYSGTETTLGADLGNAYAIQGDKDTHIIKAHKDEHIIGVENSRKLGGMNQDDIVKGALMYKNNEFVGHRAIIGVNKQTAFNDSRMVNALNENTKTIASAIKNIPEQSSAYDAVNGVWTDSIRRGSRTERNHKKWSF